MKLYAKQKLTHRLCETYGYQRTQIGGGKDGLGVQDGNVKLGCTTINIITFIEKKMVQLLWKAVWWFLKFLNTELKYDPAILSLGMYPRGLKVYVHTISFFSFFSFLRPYPRHMEVPGLGVKLELQLLAYTTATATLDPSHICNLCHSLWQTQILIPLSKARD